jgi:sterol 24-C-methyltransferase
MNFKEKRKKRKKSTNEKISAVRGYFERLGSRLGYDLLLGGVKHFGFYPKGKENISEREAQSLMQDLLARKLALKRGQLVLDAGCGQGRVGTYLAQKYSCRLIGITITPFEVGRAKQLARELDLENQCHFFLMDYTETNFPDNHFDALFTMESLVHAHNLKTALAEFFRVLKPGGKAAFFEYSLAPDFEIGRKYRLTRQEKELLEWVIQKGAMWSLRQMRHGKLKDFLSKPGFVKVYQEDITQNARLSALRLHRIARLPYKFVKFFHLQEQFFNTTVAAKFFPLVEQKFGLIRYQVTFAQKPKV